MKVITSPHYNRPNCTRQMLAHLEQCVGIEDYLVVFFVEPGVDEVVDLIRKSNLNKEITIHDNVMGCWANKKALMSRGFELSDFIVHIEDDIILAKDSLQFYEWVNSQYRNDAAIFSATSFHHQNDEEIDSVINHYGSADKYPLLCGRRQHYTSIGCALWQHKIDDYQSWTGQDIQFNEVFRKDRSEIYPLVSRCNHIGFEQGIKSHISVKEAVEACGHVVHDNNGILTNHKNREWIKLDAHNVRTREYEQFYRENHFLHKWAGNMTIDSGRFIEFGQPYEDSVPSL